jgi:hypothetical protein
LTGIEIVQQVFVDGEVKEEKRFRIQNEEVKRALKERYQLNIDKKEKCKMSFWGKCQNSDSEGNCLHGSYCSYETNFLFIPRG